MDHLSNVSEWVKKDLKKSSKNVRQVVHSRVPEHGTSVTRQKCYTGGPFWRMDGGLIRFWNLVTKVLELDFIGFQVLEPRYKSSGTRLDPSRLDQCDGQCF